MKSRINVIQIVLSLECGGLEKMVIDLASRLNNEKFNNIICCLDNFGNLADQARDKNIEVIMVKRRPGADFLLPLRLAYILKKKKANIVHTHNPTPLFYGTLAAWLARVPVLINTRHGRERRIRKRFIWAMNDGIVAISEDAKRELIKSNKLNSEKIRIIYNGTDIDRYSCKKNGSIIKKSLNISPSDFIVGTVARLSPEKDQITLLKAFSKIVELGYAVKLVIAGDGVLRVELENFCKDLNIADNVLFLGFREDIPEIVNIFDVFVLSSVTEGISLTLLEAMAEKKPIVATNVGGNPEVVIDGLTGFLVPSKNPDAMSEAVIKLLLDKELAARMGEEGGGRVEKKFSLSRMSTEYGKLYEDCYYRKV